MSVDGVAPIAQSTPHTSFVEASDPVELANLSGRRRLVRQRVLGSGTTTTPPDTPIARRRPTPIFYSSPPSMGQLVIDESSSTAGTSTNATVVVPGSTHDFLDFSWLSEQQTRLQPSPPPGSDR